MAWTGVDLQEKRGDRDGRPVALAAMASDREHRVEIRPILLNARLVMVSLIPLAFMRQRWRRPELMDQPGLELADHRREPEGLKRGNTTLSRTGAVLWRPIVRLGRDDSRA
jgi:hypothetical protein